MQRMNFTDILQTMLLSYNFLIYRKWDLLDDNFPTNFCQHFLNHWCKHAEGEEQSHHKQCRISFLAEMHDVAHQLRSSFSCGAGVAGVYLYSCGGCSVSPQQTLRNRFPLLPSSPPSPVQGRTKRRWSSDPSVEGGQCLPRGKEAKGYLILSRQDEHNWVTE